MAAHRRIDANESIVPGAFCAGVSSTSRHYKHIASMKINLVSENSVIIVADAEPHSGSTGEDTFETSQSELAAAI